MDWAVGKYKDKHKEREGMRKSGRLRVPSGGLLVYTVDVDIGVKGRKSDIAL